MASSGTDEDFTFPLDSEFEESDDATDSEGANASLDSGGEDSDMLYESEDEGESTTSSAESVASSTLLQPPSPIPTPFS